MNLSGLWSFVLAVSFEQYAHLLYLSQSIGPHYMAHSHGFTFAQTDCSGQRVGHLEVGTQAGAMPCAVYIGQFHIQCVDDVLAVCVGMAYFEPQVPVGIAACVTYRHR